MDRDFLNTNLETTITYMSEICSCSENQQNRLWPRFKFSCGARLKFLTTNFRDGESRDVERLEMERVRMCRD